MRPRKPRPGMSPPPQQRSIRPRCLGPIAILLLLPLSCGGSSRFLSNEMALYQGRFASSDHTVGDSIVIASYNIQYSEKIDVAMEDLRRDAHLADADILLLQEMDAASCQRLAESLGYDYVYYPATVHPHHDRQFGNAILARGRISDPGFTVLPKPGRLGGTERIAVFGRVQLDGRDLWCSSVHTSTVVVPRAPRIRQVMALLDSLPSDAGPMVIGGDFNTVSGSDTTRVGREMRRVDFRLAPLPPGPTVRSGWLRALSFGLVLDHLFYREMTLRRTGRVVEARGSDHYPIWAVFDWPPKSVSPAP